LKCSIGERKWVYNRVFNEPEIATFLRVVIPGFIRRTGRKRGLGLLYELPQKIKNSCFCRDPHTLESVAAVIESKRRLIYHRRFLDKVNIILTLNRKDRRVVFEGDKKANVDISSTGIHLEKYYKV